MIYATGFFNEEQTRGMFRLQVAPCEQMNYLRFACHMEYDTRVFPNKKVKTGHKNCSLHQKKTNLAYDFQHGIVTMSRTTNVMCMSVSRVLTQYIGLPFFWLNYIYKLHTIKIVKKFLKPRFQPVTGAQVCRSPATSVTEPGSSGFSDSDPT